MPCAGENAFRVLQSVRGFIHLMTKITPSVIDRILREQQITEAEPGSVLHDFAALLDFIASQHVKAGGKFDLLPMSVLTELNGRMTRPLEIRLKRPAQKSYPNLHGLYLLARASGLVRAQRLKRESYLTLYGPAMDSWAGLNPTERYFALLEAWWLRASMEIVGEHPGRGAGLQLDCQMFWTHIPAEGLKVDKNETRALSYLGLHHVALMEMFGFLRVEDGRPQDDEGWVIAQIERTEFGEALISLISQEFTPDRMLDIIFGDESEDEDKGEPLNDGTQVFDRYRESMSPYFPEWRKSLTLPPSNEFREGVFIFKVSLGKVWRRIAIPSNEALSNLSSVILKAFAFKDDHLHCFRYRDRFGHAVSVNHYGMEEPPSSDDVSVGEIPIQPGEAMVYVFDFGDNWQFEVLLETIDPPNRPMKQAQVIESHGKAPKQYGRW